MHRQVLLGVTQAVLFCRNLAPSVITLRPKRNKTSFAVTVLDAAAVGLIFFVLSESSDADRLEKLTVVIIAKVSRQFGSVLEDTINLCDTLPFPHHTYQLIGRDTFT